MDDEELDNTMSLTEMLLQELESADQNGNGGDPFRGGGSPFRVVSPFRGGGSPLFRDASTPPLTKWGAVLMDENDGEEDASMTDIIKEFEKTTSEMNAIQKKLAPPPSFPWGRSPSYQPPSPVGPNFRGPPTTSGTPTRPNGLTNYPPGPKTPINNGVGPDGPINSRMCPEAPILRPMDPVNGPMGPRPTNGPMGPNGPMNGPMGPMNGPMGPNIQMGPRPMNGPMGPNGHMNGPMGPNGPMNGPMGPNGPMGRPPFGNMRPDFMGPPNPFNNRPVFTGCPPPNCFSPFGPIGGLPPRFGPNNNFRLDAANQFTATSIPDTTIAEQLKFIKKKKPKPAKVKQPIEDPLRSPPPTPFDSKASSQPLYPESKSPSLYQENKFQSVSRVREEKLVFRSSNPAVREPSPSPLESRQHRDESYNSYESSLRMKDPITSVRLGENEALPELYDKLKLLNKELDNGIKRDGSSSSSSSLDSEPELEKSCNNKSSSKPAKKSFTKTTTGESSLPIKIVLKSAEITSQPIKPTTGLDTRIKAMLALDENPTPTKKEKVSFTLPPADDLQSNNPESTFVKVPSNPNKPHKPLLRPPSPYLSRDIYYYWHKETLKVNKLRQKHSLLHIDPTVHYRFVDNRVVGVDFGEEEERNSRPRKKSVGEVQMSQKLSNETEMPRKLLKEPEVPMKLLKGPEVPMKLLKGPEVPQKLLKEPEVPRKLLKEPEVPRKLLKEPEVPRKLLKEPEVPRKLLKEPEVPRKLLKEPEEPQKLLKEPEVPRKQLKEPELPRKLLKEPEALNKPRLHVADLAMKNADVKNEEASNINYEGVKQDDDDADIEAALAEDLKRLEDLNRQLALLDEQEQMEQERQHALLDDQEQMQQELNESVEEDMEVEYAKLEKLKRELAMLEQQSDNTEVKLDKIEAGIEVSDKMAKPLQKVKDILKNTDSSNLTADQDELIKMVMLSFVGELKKDLKRSISDTLIDVNFQEQHSRMKRAKLA